MKTTTHYISVAFYLVLILVSCDKSPQDKIIGEWRGTDHAGETASFVFYKDSNAIMIQGNLVLDGKTLGEMVTWQLDDRQDPMHLDLVATSSSGESRTLPMIIRFLTDSKIQIRMSENMEARPIEFSDSDDINQIILIKQ
jgi:hypothetical protein